MNSFSHDGAFKSRSQRDTFHSNQKKPMRCSRESKSIQETKSVEEKKRKRIGNNRGKRDEKPAVSDVIDVFLGGSCNPTTWRRDIAIPVLSERHISFYNPQVDHWHEDLVAVETHAKETSRVILFVIDHWTRSLVSMNEAVECIHRGMKVVLVIQNIQRGTLIDNNLVEDDELEQLNQARSYLSSLAHRKSVLHFKDIQSAILTIANWFHEDGSFLSFPSSRDVSAPPVLHALPSPFHASVSNFKFASSHFKEEKPCLHPLQRNDFVRADQKRLRTDTLHASLLPSRHENLQRTIFLGGTQEHELSEGKDEKKEHDFDNWRQARAIPLMKKAQLSFQGWEKVTTPSEGRQEENIDEKQILLFVVAKNTRSVPEMVEAITLICSRKALVLVVEELNPRGFFLPGKDRKVTGRELADLQRARLYLSEAAGRNDVECFSCMAQAIDWIDEQFNEKETNVKLKRTLGKGVSSKNSSKKQ